MANNEELRTGKQNNSLQLYCRGLATILNDSGITYKEFFETLDSDFTEETIRNIFRKKGKSKYGKPKTSTFTKKELQIIYDELNRHTAKFGITLPWPSEEDLRWKNGG